MADNKKTKGTKEVKEEPKKEELTNEYTAEEIIKKQEETVKKVLEDIKKEKNSKEVKVVKTDIGAKDGQTKCPKCGATDISLNVKKGLLRCNFCRFEFKPEKVEGLEKDIDNLKSKTFII